MAEYVYGKQPVLELLKHHSEKITKIICSSDERELIQLCKEKMIPWEVATHQNTKKEGKNTQGVMAEIAEFHYYNLHEVVDRIKDKKHAVVVVLDQIEDPHNFGAILRSCNGASVDAVVILDRRQVEVTPTVIKTSSGAAFYEKVIKVNNINRAIDYLKSNNFWIVGTTLETKTNYDEIDYDRNICLVVGNEGKGISKLVSEKCDYLVKIPMLGQIQSLNVASATSIMLFALRKKQKRG